MRKKTIGIMIGNAYSPHTNELMRGIYDMAKKESVNLIFFLGIHSSIQDDGSFKNDSMQFDYQFNIVYDYAPLMKVDALIFSYGSLCIYLRNPDKSAFLKKFSSIPYVLLEEPDPLSLGSEIRSDNEAGFTALMEHLIVHHGYRNFCYLSGPEENTDAQIRKKIFLDSLKRYHISFTDKQLAYGDFSPFVRDEVLTLLRNNPTVEAFVCANDWMASTAADVIRQENGPDAPFISVTGFDDSAFSDYLSPALTTVRQSSYEMGCLALQETLSILSGKERRTCQVPCELIIRDSCGCDKVSTAGSQKLREYLTHEHQAHLDSEQKTWLLPLISREMINHMQTESTFYASALKNLPFFSIETAHLFLFEKPIRYTDTDIWVCPDQMYLCASLQNGTVLEYREEERMILHSGNGISSLFPDSQFYSFNIFCLFAGEYQYGILMTNHAPEHYALAYQASMQISNGLHSYELFREQQKTEARLKELIKEVNVKNELLGELSSTDPMTELSNRRGFAEKYEKALQKYPDGTFLLLLFDLDHLKEINDTFGHSNGDLAIQIAVQLLKETLPSDSLHGRMGGDEFSSLLRIDRSEEISMHLDRLKKAFATYNNTSDLPFLVDLSYGICVFSASDQPLLSNLLKQADSDLYKNKKGRKTTVQKGIIL